MSDLHISTNATFRIEDMPPTECLFCSHKTAYFGYCGVDCSTCKASYDSDDFMGRTMMAIRESMGFDRKQFSKLIGYKPKTIKTYEFVRWTRPYRNKFIAFVTEFYKDKHLESQP